MLRTSGAHRTIQTKAGTFRTAGLCEPCATLHDQEQRQQQVKRTALSLAVLSVFIVALSYALLNYL
jgi:hypothetical protein